MVPDTYSYIEDKLPEYMCIAGNTDGYFTATLLRRFTVYYDSHKITEHSVSMMMRNLLVVEVIKFMNLLTNNVLFICTCIEHHNIVASFVYGRTGIGFWPEAWILLTEVFCGFSHFLQGNACKRNRPFK
jgi:hypothetical protein